MFQDQKKVSDADYLIEYNLPKLMIALYDEVCNTDNEKSKEYEAQCLDIWDLMFENRIGITRDLTEKQALMKMFNLIGIGERAGSGVPDIYSVWEQQGWEQPEVIEEYGPDRTILKLSFVKKAAIKNGDKKAAIKNGDKKKVTKKTEQQLERILAYMILGQEYKTSELAEVIGVKESRARALVNELVKSGRIKAEGKNKGRRYRLK